MIMNLDSPHWIFALEAAFERMERLVQHFDFSKELSGHAAYVGLTPEYLLSVVGAFIDELGQLPGGSRSDLEKLRTDLEQFVAPSYQAGAETARNLWANHPQANERKQLSDTPAEQVMVEAWECI